MKTENFSGMVLVSAAELVELLYSAVDKAVSSKLAGLSLGGESIKGEYLDVKEVSTLLKVDKTTLWRWDRKGLLKRSRVGGRSLYSRADVEQFINEGKDCQA
jgi:excisionase family DNA binding protein